ncbi:MAG: AtpZ/AtpI family protein [Bacillota bacterium]
MKQDDWRQIIKAMSMLTQVGLMIVVSAGIGFAVGYFIDYLIGFELLFKLTGLITGVAAGFYAVYKLILNTLD